MTKPKVLIFSGYGLNGEKELKEAFESSGANVDIVHINDLIKGIIRLEDYQILSFPAGFSFGDDTGSGNAYANLIRNHLWEDFQKFIKDDKLILALCNGFQILINLGLLPAIDGKYGERQAALMPNKNNRFINRWVDIKAEGKKTPWLKDIDSFPTTIAHGEGRFYADSKTLEKLNKSGQIVLRYFEGEIYDYQKLDPNPNGSVENIAGVIDKTGKILGMMPHPERGILFTQRPDWPVLKEKYKREGIKIPKEGPGTQIFKNGVNYFK